MGVTDEVAARQGQLLDDIDMVASTPKLYKKPSEAFTKNWIERFKKVADEPVDFLDDIEFNTIGTRASAMGKQVEGMRRAALDTFRKMDGSGRHANWKKFELKDAARDEIITRANSVLSFTTDVGMSEVAGSIKRKVISANADPASIRKGLMEAAFHSKLRRGVSAGADQADDLLTTTLTDKKLWGAEKAKANKSALDALDEIRKVWDDLGDTHIAKKIEELELTDGLALQKGAGTIERLRKATDALANEGMLSEAQITSFTARFIAADDAIKRGTEAYMDAIKVNRVVKNATKKLQKEASLGTDIPTSPESFAAAKMESVRETAMDIATFATKGLDLLLDTRPLAYASRGVGALHGLTELEKYEVYEELERELTTMVGNPSYMIENLGAAIDRGAGFDPVGADMAAAKTVNTMYYLQSQMPKRDTTIFGRNTPQPMSAVEEFLEKWAAAYDPVSVGYEALQGTVTPEMIDSIRSTSPRTYSELQIVIAELLSQVPAEKANPSALVGASLFLGGLDPMYSGDFISALQSNYAQTAAQDEVINGPRQMGSIRSRGAERSLTTSQRQQTY
jgi:hypothetical protein